MSSEKQFPPAYPPVAVNAEGYQQYPMGRYSAGGGGVEASPVAPPEVQHHHQHQQQDREEQQRDADESESDELLPGSGPGGVPHKYFKLDFNRFFEEDKDTKTFPAIYKAVGLVYKYIKLVLYHVLVIVLGIPLAILWAILNGIMIFVYVWIWGPVLRFFIIHVYSVAPAATVPVRAILGPVFETIGLMLSHIRFKGKLSRDNAACNKPTEQTV